jgi:hypothetical protein
MSCATAKTLASCPRSSHPELNHELNHKLKPTLGFHVVHVLRDGENVSQNAGLVSQVMEHAMLVSSPHSRSDLRYNPEVDLPCTKAETKGFGTICSIPLKSIFGSVCGVLQVMM